MGSSQAPEQTGGQAYALLGIRIAGQARPQSTSTGHLNTIGGEAGAGAGGGSKLDAPCCCNEPATGREQPRLQHYNTICVETSTAGA